MKLLTKEANKTNPLSLEEIERMAHQIAARSSIDADFLKGHIGFSTVPYRNPYDAPRIEIRNDGYHYIYEERGKRYEDRQTADIQELLYWIFEEITSSLAMEFAIKNPYPPQWEWRRGWFKKHLELLGAVVPDFKMRLQKELMGILQDVPFEDGLPNNMDYEEWEESVVPERTADQKSSAFQPRATFDSYGSKKGRFASPITNGVSVPFAQRSLPGIAETGEYHKYEVLKPFDVESGIAAPWFGQPGGGVQYMFTHSIEWLMRNKYIIPTD